MKLPAVTASAIQGGRVDEFVRVVAEHLVALQRLDLREAVELGEAADAAALRTRLKRYRAIEADAERAQRALEHLALQAQLRAGELLLELDAGGPGRGKKSERTAAAEEAGLDGRQARRLVELAELDEEVREEIVEQLVGAGKRVTVRGVLDVAERRTSVGSDEWYTPREFADAARRVFGGRPDCDAASCPVAQIVIGAARWWSAAEPELGEAERAAGISARKLAAMRKAWGGVGVVYRFPTGEVIEPDEAIEDEAKRAKAFAKVANLHGRISHAHQLRGTVWLNPPYSFPSPFVRAVIEGYLGSSLEDLWQRYAAELGTTEAVLDETTLTASTWRASAIRQATRALEEAHAITEAIILVNVATATAAGQQLLAACSAVCFVSRRISFRDAHGEQQDGNRYEQAVFYLGRRPQVFAREFGPFGHVMVQVPEEWRDAA